MNKSIKLQNDTYLDSLGIIHKKQTLNEILSGIDYTSKCKFENCNLLGGKILKFGKFAIFQIAIEIKVTNSWLTIIKIPEELYPISVIDNGIKLNGTDFWVYRDGSIKGSVTAGTRPSLVGFYIIE